MTKNEINDWGRKLEVGSHDEPLLALAERLAQSAAMPGQASEGFRSSLRARLTQPEAHARPSLRRWLAPAALAVAALAIAILLSLQNAQPATAAELLEAANQAYVSQLEAEGVLYTQYSIYTFQGQASQLRAESWLDQSSGNTKIQIIDQQDQLSYFALRTDEELYRSVHSEPVGRQEVQALYHLEEAQYQAALEEYGQLRPSEAWPPYVGGLDQWLELTTWFEEQGQGCQDLYCMLGIDQSRWTCEGQICQYTLLDLPAPNPPVQLELVFSGESETSRGIEAYQVEMRTSQDDALIRELKFDTADFSLLEITAYSLEHQHPIARLAIERRQLLPSSELSFQELPEGLAIVAWQGERDLFDTDLLLRTSTPWLIVRADQFDASGISTISAQVVQASPPTSELLGGSVDFSVTVSFAPLPDDALELKAQLCRSAPRLDIRFSANRNCSDLPSQTVTVAAGQRKATVNFGATVASDWPEQVSLMLVLSDDQGAIIYQMSDRIWEVAP